MSHILFIDDELALGRVMTSLLEPHGHRVRCADSVDVAFAAMEERQPDLILLELDLGGADGLDLLRRIRAAAPSVPVVVVSGYASVQAAVAAMKLGAADFVTKPFDNRELVRTLERLLPKARPAAGPLLAGDSPKLRAALDVSRRFAATNINVLLSGETGTGKEVFARTIHAASKLADGPFVPVDCSTLSESLFESELFGHERGAFTGAVASRAGRFEQAQGGTLFLDEIGNLAMPMQAKLLRVLQERTFVRVGGREQLRLNVRIVSATHVDLRQAIRDGRFREDLYYRLNEVCISLPALHERAGDIPLLARHFVEMYGPRFDKPGVRISPEALCALERHAWPGNIRELESVMKVAIVLADEVILPCHLPAAVLACGPARDERPQLLDDEADEPSDLLRLKVDVDCNVPTIDLRSVCAETERALLTALVQRRRLRGTRLAKLLNVDPKTLRVKLRRYGLSEV